MELTLAYRPFPVHTPYHLTGAREKCALGAVGSGKTIALVADAIRLGIEQPGSTILVCRLDIPSLRDTTEAELINMLATPLPGHEGEDTLWDHCEERKSGGHIDRFWLPNGSEIRFRSLDDWRKLMSQNVSAIYIDEASQVGEETYTNLMSRLRQQEPNPRAKKLYARNMEELNRVWAHPRQFMALASNPEGHNWIWSRFVHRPGPNTRLFRSTSFDNPTFYNADGEPNSYLRSLMQMPELWVRRFVLCEDDAFAGQIFGKFDPRIHTHTHFDPVGEEWERGMGMDWGIRNPTAISWWCRRKGEKKWYKYREWQSYDPTIPGAREQHDSLSVDEVAQVIRRLEHGEKIRWRGADPMVFRRQSGDKENQSIDYYFQQNGISFQPGAKDYGNRISAINQRLERNELSVSKNCPQTIMAWQQYRWEDLSPTSVDKKDAPEKPQKKDDHLPDSDQYFFTLFTANPMEIPEVDSRSSIEIWEEQLRKRMDTQAKSKSATLNKRPTIGPM